MVWFYVYYIDFYPQIKIPVLLLNALDDPLVPEELLATPHNHISKKLGDLLQVARLIRRKFRPLDTDTKDAHGLQNQNGG